MAIGVHVAFVELVPVSATGSIVDKKSATIGAVATASLEHRIIEDATIASTTGRPTIKDYIEAEAAIDYVVRHMDQYMIVTYDQGAANTAT